MFYNGVLKRLFFEDFYKFGMLWFIVFLIRLLFILENIKIALIIYS